MFSLFITVFEMSIKASVVMAFVLLFRMLLSKAPKRFSYLLWSVVGVRLLVPFGISSNFSIFSIFKGISKGDIQSIQKGSVAVEQAVESGASWGISGDMAVWVTVLRVAQWTWLIGLAVMLVYGIVSYVRMHRRMNTAMLLEGNIFESDRIESPFALGIISPKIYLPVGLNPIQQGCIVAHEKYHIKRLDHIVKLVSFLLLSLHWFNPLCWVAFRKMTMDMEMSCDEGVLGKSNDEALKKVYSKTLLAIGSSNRKIVPNPVSFDGGVAKKRILHILKYKAPKVSTVAVCYVLCLVVIFACSTDTKADEMISSVTDKASEIVSSVENGDGSNLSENVEMSGSVKYLGDNLYSEYYVAPDYQ